MIVNKTLDKPMDTCPCCSEPLLRHARHGEIYWYCSHCHQEMPNLSSAIALLELHHQSLESVKALGEILEPV